MEKVHNEAELMLLVCDERDHKLPPRQYTAKIQNVATLSMKNLHEAIFGAAGIPKKEHESLFITFKSRESIVALKDPTEIAGFESLSAVIATEKELNWSDAVEQDKSHITEEHINPMPFFIMHHSVAHTVPILCGTWMEKLSNNP